MCPTRDHQRRLVFQEDATRTCAFLKNGLGPINVFCWVTIWRYLNQWQLRAPLYWDGTGILPRIVRFRGTPEQRG
jgi:hypothetical protein